MSWVVKLEWTNKPFMHGAHYEPTQMWKWAADLRAHRLAKQHGSNAKVTVITRERAMVEQWPGGVPWS